AQRARNPPAFLEDQPDRGAVTKEILRAGGAGLYHRSPSQTVSLCRPLALRRARTLRPPLVFILSRNPCVRFRAKFECCRIVADMRTLLPKLLDRHCMDPLHFEKQRVPTVPDIQYLLPPSIQCRSRIIRIVPVGVNRTAEL